MPSVLASHVAAIGASAFGAPVETVIRPIGLSDALPVVAERLGQDAAVGAILAAVLASGLLAAKLLTRCERTGSGSRSDPDSPPVGAARGHLPSLDLPVPLESTGAAWAHRPPHEPKGAALSAQLSPSRTRDRSVRGSLPGAFSMRTSATA